MRQLTDFESDNVRSLTENSVAFTLIEPTETGLKKSIMDATGPVRSYLKEEGVHDYYLQGQGADHKVLIDSIIYDDFATTNSNASLYRPNTKQGDPRIWFSGLSRLTNPNEILAIIFFDKKLHVVNISKSDIGQLMSLNLSNPIKELLEEINSNENSVALELLGMLRDIAHSGPIPSLLDADTSVGRTLETALGIDINSSKQPDYKGIELKSFRNNRGNRKTLFAQVPDWKRSPLKSSAQILDAFGYEREDDFKLYCTVSATNFNSQGLSLRIEDDLNDLIEYSNDSNIGDAAVWSLEKLHKRLLTKHRETFWVSAQTEIVDGREHFIYTEVEHTKKPIATQFDLLVSQGIITMDHLIKRNSKGKVVEKGPLFKIRPNSLDLLFPPSVKHDLLNY